MRDVFIPVLYSIAAEFIRIVKAQAENGEARNTLLTKNYKMLVREIAKAEVALNAMSVEVNRPQKLVDSRKVEVDHLRELADSMTAEVNDLRQLADST